MVQPTGQWAVTCVYDETLIIIFSYVIQTNYSFFHVNGGMILTWKSHYPDIPRTIGNVTKNIMSKNTYMNTKK